MKRVDVFYQGEGICEINHLETDSEQTLAAVKAAIVQKHGGDVDLLIFVEEGEGEPVAETRTVATIAGPAGAKIHLHRCRHVEVLVSFAGKTAKRVFAPSATVARVKQWAALHEFGMTEEEAGEHVLQISGSHDRPAPGAHIGTLTACPACRVHFDLLPDERINGAAGAETIES